MPLSSSGCVRVLSIDGGGIRGLIPALALTHLEKIAGQPACSLFDVIVGTSTGGILALGLAVPGENASPAYSASDLAQLYPLWGKRIFPSGGSPTLKERLLGRGVRFTERMGKAARGAGSPFGGNPHFGGNARHTASGLEEAVEAYFGTKQLSEALVEVMVTSFDTTHGRPVVFSRRATRVTGRNYAMVSIARATSAAPTFLPPQALELAQDGPSSQLVDGGVWANNPVILGYHHALRMAAERHGPPEGIVVVSLGTGAAPAHGGAFGSSRSWLGAMRGLASMATDTNVPDFVMRYHFAGDVSQRYWRFQTHDAGSAGAMDDPTPKRLELLTNAANALIDTNRREFDALAAALCG